MRSAQSSPTQFSFLAALLASALDDCRSLRWRRRLVSPLAVLVEKRTQRDHNTVLWTMRRSGKCSAHPPTHRGEYP